MSFSYSIGIGSFYWGNLLDRSMGLFFSFFFSCRFRDPTRMGRIRTVSDVHDLIRSEGKGGKGNPFPLFLLFFVRNTFWMDRVRKFEVFEVGFGIPLDGFGPNHRRTWDVDRLFLSVSLFHTLWKEPRSKPNPLPKKQKKGWTKKHHRNAFDRNRTKRSTHAFDGTKALSWNVYRSFRLERNGKVDRQSSLDASTTFFSTCLRGKNACREEEEREEA